MKIAANLILTILFAIPLHAQQDRISRITLYSGLAFDLGTTEAARRAGYQEANPILGQNPYRRIATATGLTVGTDWLIQRYIRPEHPKLARVLNFTIGSVHIGAGVWNLKYPKSSTTRASF